MNTTHFLLESPRWYSVRNKLQAAPLLRSISGDIEMLNLAATSQTVLGLCVSPNLLLRFFSKACQLMYPMARTLWNSSSLPNSVNISSSHWGRLVERPRGYLDGLINYFWSHFVHHVSQTIIVLALLLFQLSHPLPNLFHFINVNVFEAVNGDARQINCQIIIWMYLWCGLLSKPYTPVLLLCRVAGMG